MILRWLNGGDLRAPNACWGVAKALGDVLFFGATVYLAAACLAGWP